MNYIYTALIISFILNMFFTYLGFRVLEEINDLRECAKENKMGASYSLAYKGLMRKLVFSLAARYLMKGCEIRVIKRCDRYDVYPYAWQPNVPKTWWGYSLREK